VGWAGGGAAASAAGCSSAPTGWWGRPGRHRPPGRDRLAPASQRPQGHAGRPDQGQDQHQRQWPDAPAAAGPVNQGAQTQPATKARGPWRDGLVAVAPPTSSQGRASARRRRSPTARWTGRCCLGCTRHGEVLVGSRGAATRSYGTRGGCWGCGRRPAGAAANRRRASGSLGGAHQADVANRGGRPPSGDVLDQLGGAGPWAGVVTGKRRGDLLDHAGAGVPAGHLPDPPLWGDAQAGGLHQPPAMLQRVDQRLVRRKLAAPATPNAPAARGGADHGPTAHLPTSPLQP
jgi:hypothetical protein